MNHVLNILFFIWAMSVMWAWMCAFRKLGVGPAFALSPMFVTTVLLIVVWGIKCLLPGEN
jgi:hypothetical protein